MPRHIRELPVQDLLARVPRVPSRGLLAEGEVPFGHSRQLSEQEQWGFQPADGKRREREHRGAQRRSPSKRVQRVGVL